MIRNGYDLLKIIAIIIAIGLTVRNPLAAVTLANTVTSSVRDVLIMFTHPITSRIAPATPNQSHGTYTEQHYMDGKAYNIGYPGE